MAQNRRRAPRLEYPNDRWGEPIGSFYVGRRRHRIITDADESEPNPFMGPIHDNTNANPNTLLPTALERFAPPVRFRRRNDWDPQSLRPVVNLEMFGPEPRPAGERLTRRHVYYHPDRAIENHSSRRVNFLMNTGMYRGLQATGIRDTTDDFVLPSTPQITEDYQLIQSGGKSARRAAGGIVRRAVKRARLR